MLTTRIDRQRCIGIGNCIALAPTAFDWADGRMFKATLLDTSSVDEELLKLAAYSCPTQAILLEEVADLLPWQLRQAVPTAPSGPQRVEKTFMFTDIVKSTNLVEAIGDDAWEILVGWHDQALRELFAEHDGEEVVSTGDGFFVGFDGPERAIACAIAIQRRLALHRRTNGFAPSVRIGVHSSPATQVEHNFRGRGVHEAARIAALAEGGEILASVSTAGAHAGISERRTVTLKGISEPIEVVSIDWD